MNAGSIPPDHFRWRKDRGDWVLVYGRRKVGRVVPDSKYAGMWRCALAGGRLSDMVNLTRAKAATLDAGMRELEREVRGGAAA
jgi:hypothetical protein